MVLSALWALNHVVGAFVFAGDDVGPLLFVLLALLGIVATVVLLGPYREQRMWACHVVSVEVVALMAVSLFTQPRVGAWYLEVGLLVAVAPEFFKSSEKFRIVTEAGLAIFGVALRSSPLQTWVGWIVIVNMVLLAILTLVFRDMVPLAFYVITLCVGVTLFR